MRLQINPFVRFSRIQRNFPYGMNFGYDHRLFYCLSGQGVITVNEIEYEMSQGAILYWRSGCVYSYLPDESCPYELIGINFDFDNPNFEKTTPIPPGNKDCFNRDCVIEQEITTDAIFENTLYLKNGFMLHSLFESINVEFTQKRLCYYDCCSAILSRLIVELIRCAKSGNYEPSLELVSSVMAYIDSHLQEDLSNNNIGRHFGYHANYINRLIVGSTGKSLHSYVIECRINKAVELLQDTALGVGEISDKVGFYDVAGFSKTFRKIVGISPSEYRRASHI